MQEKALQGRRVVGSLWQIMKGRTVNMKITKVVRDSITYGMKVRSRIQATEMSYLRGSCGVNRMDGESNKSV